jgi:hypothetical protein
MEGTGEADPGAESGGAIFAKLFDDLLTAQEARKSSIEQRGLSVITTSGALVTLLFGLVSLITKSQTFALPKAAHGPIGIAIGFFVCAAILGLLTNIPLFYMTVDPKGLQAIIDRRWQERKASAELRVAATQQKLIERAQSVNSIKAWILVAAMSLEVCAVLLIGIAVGTVLRSA